MPPRSGCRWDATRGTSLLSLKGQRIFAEHRIESESLLGLASSRSKESDAGELSIERGYKVASGRRSAFAASWELEVAIGMGGVDDG